MPKAYELSGNFFGEKLYQKRARIILPILIRQAEARSPIYYEAIAEEVGMPNPRNLDFPLGCIGHVLNELSRKSKMEIPHIQALVVNKQSHLPGPGFDEFLKTQGKIWKSKAERRAVIEEYWTVIFAYPYWSQILSELGLAPTQTELIEIIEGAGYGGGGEGADHLALKKFVGRNPSLVQLRAEDGLGELEKCLPSGDSVDVVFERKNLIVAVEVKGLKSSKLDIARGLFQCIKYKAVLKARAGYEHDRRRIAAYLVLGGRFPNELVPLRNSLNVKVIEGIVPK